MAVSVISTTLPKMISNRCGGNAEVQGNGHFQISKVISTDTEASVAGGNGE
jgi:hypothetical protein